MIERGSTEALSYLFKLGVMMKLKSLFYIFFLFMLNVPVVNSLPMPELTEAELNYLNNKEEILKCVDPLWMPFESVNDKNQHIGIIADVINIVADKIAIPIKLVETKDWSESHEFLKRRQCDLVTSDAIVESKAEYYENTVPFLHYKDVYITRKNTELALNFETISDKKIGFVKDYPTIALAKEKFPNTNIIEVGSVDAGVLAVSKGEVYAFVDLLPSISYAIQKQGLTNLKVAGHIDINIPVVMSVRSDQPELLSILNKALLSISNKKKNEIFNRWVSIDYEATANYVFILEIIAVLVFIMIISFYWISKNRLLQQKVIIAKERERIMRDMHDGVGGNLVATLALLDSDKITTEQVKVNIADCLADLRVVILSLEPASSNLETLLGMFRHNISEKVQSAGLQLIWEVGYLDNVSPLSSKAALNILRILQESVTNVIKHSGANEIKIVSRQAIVGEKKYVVISILDDGGKQQHQYESGYGLKNMRFRAKELGGFLTIGHKSIGTCVTLNYPI